jgi:hypothetical protein
MDATPLNSESPRLVAPLSEGESPKTELRVGKEGVILTSIEQVWRMAQLLHRSQLVPSSFRSPEQIVVALLRAIELQLPPLQALEGMSVINNKVGLMGDLALSMVEASGLLEAKRVEYAGEGPALSCTVTLKRKGRAEQDYSFSVLEARAAGLYERSTTWRLYPKRMTYYRALGFGLRDEFSDVLKGIKTVEELADYPPPEENKK